MNTNNGKEKGQNFIRGSQIYFQNLRMFMEASSTIFKVLLGLFFLVEIGILCLWVDHIGWYYFGQYAQAKLYTSLLPFMSSGKTNFVYLGHTYQTTYGQVAHDPIVQAIAQSVLHKIIISSICTAVVIGIVSFWVTGFFRKEGKKLSEDKYIRGAKRVPNSQYAFQCKGFKRSPFYIPVVQNSTKVLKRNDYSIAKVTTLPLPLNFEVQHVFIHGTTGVGKSQLTFHFANQIQKLNEKRPSKRVYIDVGCNLIAKLYNPETDIILSPFDRRSVNWDLWSEFSSDIDFANFAAYMIPLSPTVSDPYWINASRMMLASAAYSMADEQDRSIEKLLKLLLLSELSELCRYLGDTEAATVASEKTAKTSISVRSVLATYVRPLKYLMGLHTQDGVVSKPFSIKAWIQDDSVSGSLFITIPEDKREEMRGLITLWFSCAIDALLAQEPNPERRVYFICDELGVMFKMNRLMTGLALGRKYGASFILGMQSYNQCVETYGINAAKELIDLMSYRFYFKSNEESTAKFVSASLGDEEIESATLNRTYSGNQDRQGVSIINQLITRPVVTHSEIMDLKNLECFVKPSEGLPITKIHLMPYLAASHCVGLSARAIQRNDAIDAALKNATQQVVDDVAKAKKIVGKDSAVTPTTADTKESKPAEAAKTEAVVAPIATDDVEEPSAQALEKTLEACAVEKTPQDNLDQNQEVDRAETHTRLDGQGNPYLGQQNESKGLGLIG